MKFTKLVKSLLSFTLAIAVLTISLFTVSAEESAQAINTKVSSAPHTEIYSITNFTQADFDENFTKWSNGGATIAGGVLTIPSGGNTRDTAYMNNVKSLNQHVKVSFATDGTTQAYNYIWLRVNGFHRAQYNDEVPMGYIVKTKVNKNYCSTTLEKAYVNDSGAYSVTEIGSLLPNIDSLSSSNAYLDYTVEGNAIYDEVAKTTVITVKVFKGSNLMNCVSFEDSESELQVAGKVGIACAGWNGADSNKLRCTAFDYHTTDNDVVKNVFNAASFENTNSFMTINGNNNASAENGQLKISAGSGNSRNSAHFLMESFSEYTLSTVIANPHTADSKPASNPMIWLKANRIVRASNANETAPYGYLFYVSWNETNNIAHAELRKQPLNLEKNDIQGEIVIGDKNLDIDTLSSDGVSLIDLKVEATITCDPDSGTNNISVRLYKGTYSAADWVITATDVESTLSGKGMIGLSANESDAVYKSLKVSAKDETLPAYIEENTAKADGTIFGQQIWLEKSTTYQFSAMVGGDISLEPLAIRYKTASSGTTIEITDATADVVKGTYYNKYTYTFNTADFTDASTDNAMRIPVFVGYTQKNSAVNNVKYTDFELRKVVNSKVGGNLLVNGDFKLGALGWNNDLLSNWTVFGFGVSDSRQFGEYTRESYYRETNKANYLKNFAVENYADYLGDANEDGKIDLLDLIRSKKNIANNVYAFYADMNLDGEIGANDLVLIRKTILKSKK